jgi:hypothetical protein
MLQRVSTEIGHLQDKNLLKTRKIYTIFFVAVNGVLSYINPYHANVENMVSS